MAGLSAGRDASWAERPGRPVPRAPRSARRAEGQAGLDRVGVPVLRIAFDFENQDAPFIRRHVPDLQFHLGRGFSSNPGRRNYSLTETPGANSMASFTLSATGTSIVRNSWVSSAVRRLGRFREIVIPLPFLGDPPQDVLLHLQSQADRGYPERRIECRARGFGDGLRRENLHLPISRRSAARGACSPAFLKLDISRYPALRPASISVPPPTPILPMASVIESRDCGVMSVEPIRVSALLANRIRANSSPSFNSITMFRNAANASLALLSSLHRAADIQYHA